MPNTEKLTIESPGNYASASEVISEGLDTLRGQDEAIEHWLRDEIVPIYERIKKGQERTIPAAEVFAELWDHHKRTRP